MGYTGDLGVIGMDAVTGARGLTNLQGKCVEKEKERPEDQNRKIH